MRYAVDVEWTQLHGSAAERSPEQELFWAVVLQAFNDMRDQAYTPVREASLARSWLLHDERDFYLVCSYANVDPFHIRRIAWLYAKHLANGGVRRAIALKENEKKSSGDSPSRPERRTGQARR